MFRVSSFNAPRMKGKYFRILSVSATSQPLFQFRLRWQLLGFFEEVWGCGALGFVCESEYGFPLG